VNTMDQYFEKPELCAECGGRCCKRLPGLNLPEDFGSTKEEIAANLAVALESRKYAVDWWAGDLEGTEHSDVYFIRPATKGAERIYDPSWGGECVFLAPTGCSLPPEKRPSGCKLLEPFADEECKVHGASKKDAARAWVPYQDLIDEIADGIEEGGGD